MRYLNIHEITYMAKGYCSKSDYPNTVGKDYYDVNHLHFQMEFLIYAGKNIVLPAYNVLRVRYNFALSSFSPLSPTIP